MLLSLTHLPRFMHGDLQFYVDLLTYYRVYLMYLDYEHQTNFVGGFMINVNSDHQSRVQTHFVWAQD